MFGTGTARERADRALDRGAAWLSLAAAVGDVGFWRVDLTTGVRWMSPLGKRVLGFAADAVISPTTFGSLLHPDDRERVMAAQSATERSGVPFNEEFRIIPADGAERLIHAAAQLQHEREGDMLVGVIVDITSRRQAEREVREQQQQLAHLSRVGVLAALSGAIAHELNQPLAAILANARTGARLLRSEPGPAAEEVRQVLAEIISEDRRAADVLSRLSGMMHDAAPRLETIRPAALISDVLAIARGDLRRRDVSTEVHVAVAVQNVRGDRVQLQQVLLNLIVNACDSMDNIPPRSRLLRLSAHADDDGFTVFSVSDTGPGISIEPADRIFDPFVTSKQDGGGLGLAICRKIVYAHAGRIHAENDPAGGAVVQMRIPASNTLTDDEPELAMSSERNEAGHGAVDSAKATVDQSHRLRVRYRMLLDQAPRRAPNIAGFTGTPPGEDRP